MAKYMIVIYHRSDYHKSRFSNVVHEWNKLTLENLEEIKRKWLTLGYNEVTIINVIKLDK